MGFVNFIERNFILVLALSLLTSYFVPGISNYLLHSIPFLLALTIFFMGLNLEFEELFATVRKPKALIVGISAQYLFMPLIAFLVAKAFNLPAEFAIGLMLVGAAPGGVASNVMVYLARADLPLSVAMTFISTFIAPVVMPVMMLIYAQSWVKIDFWSLLSSAVEVVLLPIILGVFFKRTFPGFSSRLNKITPSMAILAVCLIVTVMFDVNYQKLATYDQDLVSGWSLLRIVAAIITHNVVGIVAAYYFARLFLREQKQLRAIAIESSLQNAGLAMVLVSLHFAPLAAVPCMFSAILHLIFAATLAGYWKNH